MAICTKTRSVLHRVDLHGAEGVGLVTFERILDEQDEPQRRVRIDVAAWHDLGEPDVITVTIEPGDRLNEDG